MSEKLQFCTLFNINFLSRALCLYNSLQRNCRTGFVLHVFCMDEATEAALKLLKLPHIHIVSFHDFVQGDLKNCYETRNRRSFYWTCSAFSVEYCLSTLNLPHVTYLDADTYFFSDPLLLVENMKQASVSISPHNYTPEHDYSEHSGKYCVQFVTFKNEDNGRKVAHWWKEACKQWCYDYFEDGKFGDQKYLDDWTTRFQGIHEIEEVGAGLAPWNFDRLLCRVGEDKKLHVEDSLSSRKSPLVFYHFHGLRFLKTEEIMLCDEQYHVPSLLKLKVYEPYLREILRIEAFLRRIGIKDFNYQVDFNKRHFLLNPLKERNFDRLFENFRFYRNEIVSKGSYEV